MKLALTILLLSLAGCIHDPWSDNIGPKTRPVDPFSVGVTNQVTKT